MARTVEFNREKVLESSMHIFWEKGYSLTSIPSLVNATQLNPGSIYAAFDSKEGLFLETLEYYGNRSLATLKQTIQEAESPLTGIETFFKALISKSNEEEKRGCLLVNTLLEMSSHNPKVQAQVNKQLSAVEAELLKALESAQRLGEISTKAKPDTLAKYLMVNIWGLRVLAKTRAGDVNAQDEANIVLDQILTALSLQT